MSLALEMDWLGPKWRRLHAYIETARVPQALLIVGRDGVGKTALAEAFGKRLLCRNPAEYACGVCASCRLFEAKSHPDFLRIEPEEPGKIIPVDAIRGLIANLALKPQYSVHRVVLITPAHMLNISSSNSLLKTLEEPDEQTTLVLLTDSPELLPATILSRCQRLDIPLPERSQALSWLMRQGLGEHAEVLLAMARGAPLKALGLADSGAIEKRGKFFLGFRELLEGGGEPIRLAENWSKFSCETLVEWMISWTMDLIRLCAAPGHRNIDNPDLGESLETLAQQLNLQCLFGHLDRLNASRRMLAGQANRQLLLEDLLIRWLHGRHNNLG